MAAISETWLGTKLPQPSVSGFSSSPESQLTRTSMSSGFSKIRRRNTRPPDKVNVTWEFTAREFSIFEYYFHKKLNGGLNEFDLITHDEDGNSRWDLPWADTAATFRFCENPPYTVSVVSPTEFSVSALLQRVGAAGISESDYKRLVQSADPDLLTTSDLLDTYVNSTLGGPSGSW